MVDLPQVDGIDCEDHSLNVRDSLLNLSQSLESTNPPGNDKTIISQKENDINNDKTNGASKSDSGKDSEISDSSSESSSDSQSEEEPLTPLQTNVLAAAQLELTNNVEKFLNYQRNHNLTHHNLQSITQTISSHYLSLIAYYNKKFGDLIAEQLATLEKRELNDQFVQELADSCKKSK